MSRDTTLVAARFWFDAASVVSENLSSVAVDRRWKCRVAGSAHDRSRSGDHDASVDADSVNGSENNVTLGA